MGDHEPKRPWIFNPGDLLDHFRVVRPIDRGGMAEVYLARDTTLGRKVALKVIQPGAFESDDAAERFLLEARTTAQFNHPHIITIHTVGRHEGQPFLALEFLEGETLRERIRKAGLGPVECLRWTAAIADALSEAHARGVLHRDLKPENILLARDGRLRVLDFGLARTLARREEAQHPDYDSGMTVFPAERDERHPAIAIETAGTSGTPAYMAPEQWHGQDLSGGADVWALGVILYELLIGHRPYAGSGVVEEVRHVRLPDPVPMPVLSKNVSDEVIEIMMQCLEKEARVRPSAADVKAVLDSALHVPRIDEDGQESPFRGLLPFNESHRHMFFGRDSEISAFVERLREVPILAVVGPSGAGKSSFVRAGVIPRLRESSSLLAVELRPGAKPFHALAGRFLAVQRGRSSGASAARESDSEQAVEQLADELAASPERLSLLAQGLAESRATRVVIFVDQLEELFTLVPDASIRGRFLRALSAAADDVDGPVRVILTVREEFLSRLAEGPELREALSHITILRSPDGNQLREILTLSVRRIRYGYDDPNLVNRMVDEVEDELSSLPLLQFAGQKLWEGRDRDRNLLLESVYTEMGGVAGALATHADGVLAGLTAREVGLARTILLRLVTPEGTRRIAPRSQVLLDLPDPAGEVLDRLVGARLIAVRRSTERDAADLELVHESLMVAWKRFARWLDGSHEEREFLDEVERAAELWRRRGRRADELWHGEALREAEATVRRLELDLPDVAGGFLDAGRRREDQRARRRRLLVAGVFAALSCVAVLLGFQRHEARSERDRADEQRLAAERGQAEALREGARAAWLQGDIFEARCKLRRSLEILDSTAGRSLWWQFEGDPLRWRDPGETLYFQVAVSADGRLLAVSGGDAAVTLFDARTREARLLTGHDDATLGVTFSPDGRLLAAGTYGGDVVVWSLADGRMRRLPGHALVPWYLVFSADGRELVSASYDRTIRIWNVATGTTRAVLEGHEERIRRVRLSPDGTTLASGSYDGTVRLWDLATASHLKTLDADGPVLALAWNNDGSRIVSGGLGGPEIQVWDVSRGELKSTLDVGHAGIIESLDFSPDGRFVASGSRDWTVRVWDAADGSIHRVFDGQEGEIHVVRFSPDGDFLVVTSADKGLRLWNLDPPARPDPVSGHTEKANRPAFSPDGAVVATSSEDQTVRMWDVATGEVLRVITGHESELFGLAFSPDGRMLVTTGADRTARLWDAESGELLRVLRGHHREVIAAEFAPDGRLVTASVDGIIRFWDPATWTVVAELDDHHAAVIDLDFSSNGRRLASAGYDEEIRLWNTATLRQVRSLVGHEGNVYGVRFFPDGDELVSTGHDGTLRQWNVSSGESRVLERFDSIPYFFDLDHDGRRVAVPLVGGEVIVVDRASGERNTRVTHGKGAIGACFSPDGQRLATTGGDGTLLMTAVSDGKALWRAPALLTRPPLLLNHLGWHELGPGALDELPTEAAWRSSVEDRARLASQSEDGRSLCLVTWDGIFELWDVSDDRVLYTESSPAVGRLVAVAGGCVSRAADGQARLIRSDATFEVLADHATAIGVGEDEIFVGTDGGRVTIHSAGGEALETFEVDAAVTAVARAHGHTVVGIGSGDLLVVDDDDNDSPPFAMRVTPPASVTRIDAGPPGTVAAGFSNGEVALWDLTTGDRLLRARLHGRIIHLAAGPSGLVAASELGQNLNWNLASLVEPRAEFLSRIRAAAPAVWENGRPVARPAD